jgi:hypothetical protein
MTTKVIDEYGVGEDPFADDEVKPTTRSGLPSVYDALRADLEKPVDLKKDFVYKVRGRDIQLRISADLPLKKLNRWRLNATNRKTGMIDAVEFNTALIAGQTKVFVVDGKDVYEDNDAINFLHKDVIDSLNALDWRGAVGTFFGRDSEIIRCGNEILVECGYGEDEDFITDEEDENTDPLV